MIIVAYFAAGIALAFGAWVAFGLVKPHWLRAVLRSGAVALFVSPSVLVGHGFAVAPAVMVAFAKHHLVVGLVPIALVWIVLSSIILWRTSLKTSKTQWPLDHREVFLRPLVFKFLLYGVVAALAFVGLYEFITARWQAQIGFVSLGAAINYALCFAAARTLARSNIGVPALFAAPSALTGLLPITGLWYLAGLAGHWVGRNKREHALWLGAITSGTLFGFAILRALKAHKYADVAHIKIQGGVALPASLAVVLFLAGITFAILLVRAGRDRNRRAK